MEKCREEREKQDEQRGGNESDEAGCGGDEGRLVPGPSFFLFPSQGRLKWAAS